VSALTRAARTAAALEDALAQPVAVPQPLHAELPSRNQSLAKGAAGIALLHIERAHTGTGSWKTAHSWVKAATHDEIIAADTAGLYFGVPAISFMLHAAGADGMARYGAVLAGIDAHVSALAHRRIDLALQRVDCGQGPAFIEYDLFHGLTGIGAHLLAHDPGNDVLGRILAYLVRLTEPLRVDGQTLPGWWSAHDPHVTTSVGFPGGHLNLGIAHGIGGPLALLAQALRAGITVDGQLGAISSICAFLDTWRQEGDTGPWWPQWLTLDELRTGRTTQPGPFRPSWCYGTPGIGRAQQLAAIASDDTARQQRAEHALAACLSDPAQLDQVTDTSLCHGWAGLYQTAVHAAADALTPHLTAILPHLIELFIQHTNTAPSHNTGLLEGNAGLALALHTAARTELPISGWDTCLMIN
jgi:hypothetical protein